jgi:hypothetical protein
MSKISDMSGNEVDKFWNPFVDTMSFYEKKFIETKLNVKDCDIMNTSNGMQFMSLDRTMFLKIQSLLNLVEEEIDVIDKAVIMYHDQVIW